MTYFSYVHSFSFIWYDIMGNLSYIKSIFKIQERIIRVIMSSGRRDCCCELLRRLNIVLLQSQYMFSLLLFIIKNRNQFLSNLEVRGINTRYMSNLHTPLAKLMLYQEGVFYAESRVCNHLQSIIKDRSNDGKIFKTVLKRCYLLDNLFYSLEKYSNQNLP